MYSKVDSVNNWKQRFRQDTVSCVREGTCIVSLTLLTIGTTIFIKV